MTGVKSSRKKYFPLKNCATTIKESKKYTKKLLLYRVLIKPHLLVFLKPFLFVFNRLVIHIILSMKKTKIYSSMNSLNSAYF